MEKPIPQADPVAYARMKYEIENRTKASMLSKGLSMFEHAPDVRMAAKSGTPPADGLRPTTPANVPVVVPAAVGATGDVGISTVTDTSALANTPDARAIPPTPAATATPAGAAPAGATPAATTPAATTPAGATPASGSTPNAASSTPAATPAATTASDQASTSSTTGKKKKKKKTTPPPPAQ
jgi:outer membrane protein assembly factor BamD